MATIPASNGFQLVECPRDAMQGWPHTIDTATKIRYINALLQVGFHTIDFGSFVSPKAIPQMADTREVLAGLDLSASTSKLLAIVANMRGAEEAVTYAQIQYLGFPFSISPTFQRQNTNSTMEESFDRVKQMQDLCVQQGKELVIYLSMGFGNPYGDHYDVSILHHWTDQMSQLGIQTVSLADTVGLATPVQISSALEALIPRYPAMVIGVHLHSDTVNWEHKLNAALDAGCIRVDGALKGIGGCPMAQDELVGNMDTERMIPVLEQRGLISSLNQKALTESSRLAASIFH